MRSEKLSLRHLDEVGDPIVGWHFDIGNVLRFGWPEQWIKVLGKRINRIHVKEYSTKKMKEEGIYKGFDCDLTEGDNNWPAIMKALDDVGYTGWAISEQRGFTSARKAAWAVRRSASPWSAANMRW